MFRSLLLTGSLLLFSGVGYGAGRQDGTIETPSNAPHVLTLDGVLGIMSGATLPGLDVGIATRVGESPVYIGADLGFLNHGTNPTYLVIPMLGSLYYHLEKRGPLHPLLGMMAGPVFTTGGGFAATRFAVLIRPGVNIPFGNIAALNFEPRIGLIGSSFAFLPQLGATIPL